MPYGDETPGYQMMAATSPLEAVFMVDFFFPWYTQRAFVVKFGEIPDNDYDAEQYFLQVIEAELGSTQHLGEYATLVRLADDMVQIASTARS